MSHWREKQVWISGASSGLGLALTESLLDRGAKVYACARDVTKMPSHPSLVAIPCDITQIQDVQAMVERIEQHTQHLDVAILNAGACHYLSAEDLDIEALKKVFDVNVFGSAQCTKALLPLLKAAPNRPHLVGMASLSARVPFPRAEAYGASKAALSYFLESLRVDLGQWLDVTVVHPGFVKTPMTDQNDFPMPALLTPEQAVRHLANKLPKRPYTLSFPNSLSWPLGLAALFKPVWCKWVAPKLARG